jgi:hypothetical protein
MIACGRASWSRREIQTPQYIPTGSEDATPEPAVEAVEPSDSNAHSPEITADERTLSGDIQAPAPIPEPSRKTYPRRDRRTPDWFDGRRMPGVSIPILVR